MLVNLYIENYILFDKQNLSFNDGFIAVTGDTGAGKSLIIDALGYLCGNRLTSSVSKDPSKNTYLEGHFIFKNRQTLEVLAENGIEEDEMYIVSREITADNRSISRINGRSVTLSTLKSVFDKELDIHSQRDTQYLLNKNTHLSLVDAYAKHDDLLKEVKNKYKVYNKIKKEIQELEATTFNEVEIDYIKHQIEEIEKINPDEQEYQELSEQVKVMNSFEKIYENLKAPSNYINNNGAALESLFEAKDHLNRLDEFPEYDDIRERMNSLYVELSDINAEITSKLSSLEFDEYSLNQIEERLFEINRLIRRHGGTFELFNDNYKSMKQKIEYFDSKEMILSDLEKSLSVAESDYKEFAYKLSESRKKSVDKLVNDVLAHLKDLHLDNAQFAVDFNEKAYSTNGIDDIEFLVSMNKGFKLEPLIKVASGGELSRLMLGLKVVFSKLFGVSTVIFDEIDTGVSGVVASSIGYKMHELSDYSQVFAVTHLAQVAACADDNYFVEKDNTQDVGSTQINLIKGDALIEKLAIMSTGLKSDSSLEAARELYQNSQSRIADNRE